MAKEGFGRPLDSSGIESKPSIDVLFFYGLVTVETEFKGFQFPEELNSRGKR
ncbi:MULTISPECIES: hypothetical protein [Gammaproteobacteria]|uniref:hypothetical protein n=1 Tax=Gammaproteobacteria TaxID=1236 RepID=UPI0014435B75|nr:MULTISPECIES: hypothetical protein [Gammaproteobacteria]MDM1292579.1 hypothetical protein [Acinetobacter indicus]MDM1322593.1 hypothetical protein [Acinetobacter indicus]MDM1334331.1 hypothetical protein [Acinetobacter indicus]